MADMYPSSRVERFRFTPFDVTEVPPPPRPVKEAASAPSLLPAAPVAVPVPVFTEKDMENARAEGRAEGFRAGSDSVETELKKKALAQEEASKDLLGLIANRISIAAEDIRLRRREQQEAAGRLAIIIARKIAGDAVKRDPYAHIEALLGECLGLIAGEKKLIIYVSPARTEGLRQRIDMIKPMITGFEGDLTIEEDGTLGDQDCRVEWKGGSAERNSGALWQEIEALVARSAMG